MTVLLAMPEFPPEASDWRKTYCKKWLRLIEAQEQLLNTQLRIVSAQKGLIQELLESE